MAAVLQDNERIRFFSHKISISDLRPGDHIYAYRGKGLYLYAHHGIYVGEEEGEHKVIHFINTGSTALKTSDFSREELSPNPVLSESEDIEESSIDSESIDSESDSHNTQLIDKKSDLDGKIEKRTLDRFLKRSSARLVLYDVNNLGVRQRAGTVHALPSKPGNKVVETAEYFLAHPKKWGKYDFFKNNCETFCIFCKTGEKNTDVYNDQYKGIIAKCLNPFVKTFRGSVA